MNRDTILDVFLCLFVISFFVIIGGLIYCECRARRDCRSMHGVFMDDRCYDAASLRIVG